MKNWQIGALVVVSSVTVAVAAALGVALEVLLPLIISAALLVVTAAQVAIAQRQAVAADHSAEAARMSVELAKHTSDQARISADAATRLATYSHLAGLWYDLKARGIEVPQFIDPAFTTLYRPGRGDELNVRSHVYAWMCWGHAEDCFVHKYHQDPGFSPSIESYKELHCTWLYSPSNRKHFSPEFLEWVNEELLPLKVRAESSPIEGTGVFATEPLEEGEYIGFFRGADRDVPSKMSVQFGVDHHVDPSEDSVFRHLNHSCAPNAWFRGRNLYALRKIHANEEVTIDYNCSEYEASVPFRCGCGYGSCVREVRGWKHLTVEQRAQRTKIAPPWLQDVSSSVESTSIVD